MSYAIVIGTTSFRRVGGQTELLPNEVFSEQLPPENGVWDDVLQTVREKTQDEEVIFAKAAKLAEVRAEAKTRIEITYPQWRQLDAALGLLPDTYVEQMRTDIAAIITASNAAEDAIDAAVTVDAVNAVEVTWP